MSLTPKQEKFCQCIVSGMSAKDSYISAYDTKANEKTIYSEATKLLAREDVKERLDALRKPLENHARSTALTEREKKRAICWEGIELCKQLGDHTGVARYLDILNKMDAEYIQINRNIEDKPAEIRQLDTSILEKLAKSS